MTHQLLWQSRFHCSYTLLKCIGGRVYAAWHGATFAHAALWGLRGKLYRLCDKKLVEVQKLAQDALLGWGASIGSSSSAGEAAVLQILTHTVCCFASSPKGDHDPQ